MPTAYSSWLSTLSSNIPSALSSLSTSQSLDPTVLRGITAQFASQLDMLQNGVGQVEIIMTMLSGQGNAGIQLAIQHAWSRGEIVIQSKDAFQYPTINPNYLSNGWDVDIMNAGIKYLKKVGSTAPMSSYFKSENAGTSGLTTDDAINNYVANSIATEYHPIGTCSMLPLDMGGVVDTTLRVYGTANVRVIDASVMPIHVTAHTMAPAYAIAEYGADIVKMVNWPIPLPVTSTSSSVDAGATGGSATGEAAKSTGLSQNVRTIVVASTVAVGGAIILLALLIWARRRRGGKKPGAGVKGEVSSTKGGYEPSYIVDNHVPMQNLSQSSLGAPIVPYKADPRGSKYDYRMSASTMDTAQLHTASPLHEQQYLREHDQFDAPGSPGYVPRLGYNPYTPEA
ncbi:hypothetical protein FRC09_019896, partial [Ceratobasidium sp. 395]